MTVDRIARMVIAGILASLGWPTGSGHASPPGDSRIIAKTGWTIAGATRTVLPSVAGTPDFESSMSLEGVLRPPLPGADAVLDDDPATVWTTPAPTPTSVIMLMINMGKLEQIAGVSLTPDGRSLRDAAPPGRYRVETSVDAKTWTPAGEGAFGGTADARARQRLIFAKPREARYMMLGFSGVATARPKMAIAGIDAFQP